MKIGDIVYIQRHKHVYAASVLWAGDIAGNENGEGTMNDPCYRPVALVESRSVNGRRLVELIAVHRNRDCPERSIRRTERAALKSALRWLASVQYELQGELKRAESLEEDAAALRKRMKDLELRHAV